MTRAPRLTVEEGGWRSLDREEEEEEDMDLLPVSFVLLSYAACCRYSSAIAAIGRGRRGGRGGDPLMAAALADADAAGDADTDCECECEGE